MSSMAGTRERWSYDVFLSFRGEEVRKGFVSYLYESLQKSGIYTFKDDNALRRGENIASKLLEAIKTSKIHIVIISENYAASSWCLDELVQIVDCHKSDSGHMLLPIFYNVDPSDVRRIKGEFGKSLDKHKSRYLESKLERWKEALSYAANLSGFVANSYRSEANLIKDVTRDILKRLSSSYLHLPKYLVGISSRARCISELMCFGSDEVHIIGIWGMGGIGKTTIAKAAFNEFSERFEGTCFLENFGDSLKKHDGKAHLQQKLLSDILKRDDVVFKNMDHEVKHRFRNKRVFVVVDDVKDLTQLNSMAIDFSCFGPGSRIIITCRNTHLLEQLGVQKMYSPEELGGDESLELVSWHAFRKNEPPEAFLQSSKKLVEYCNGLPLAIEVLGALLFNRTIPVWEDTLEMLKETPDTDVQAKLQISYDELKKNHKDIFLDISCFFVGMDKDYVTCILDGCKLYPKLGLSVLKERCLIKFHDNKLMMHDLLRDMGRQIVREISPKNCGRWSRLWNLDNVTDVFTNFNGTDAIEGISLMAEAMATETFEVKAFKKLESLRLLQLSHVQLEGSYEHIPKSLRWLCWFKFSRDTIPTKLHLENLVVMDLQYSNLKRLWDDQEQPRLKKLKYLDLSHSIQLTETPDFSYLPNLEKLLLTNCERLVLIHKSIGNLDKKLVLLNLKDCTRLDDLPLELYKLKSLETLILSGCSQLERLDDALGELESLTTLKADYTALRQIPSSINQLKKIKVLSFNGCKELTKHRECVRSDDTTHPLAVQSVLFSLNGLCSLKTLRLGSCNLSDGMIPNSLEGLSCLEELDLGGNNFHNLQTDFAGLLSLQILKLDSCSGLESVLNLPKKLRSFYARNCIKLEKTPNLSECKVLQSLHLTNCFNLLETPGLEKLKTVGVIHMEMCNRLQDTYKERIMQRWAVAANGGVFIPGSSLPNWVSFKNKTRSISFVVPGNLNLNDLVGFTLWTRYMSQQNDVMCRHSPKITLKNKTKGNVWSRNPATDHIRMFQKIHIWQGHYSNEDFSFETGDEVEVYVDFGDQVTILETGLTFVYKKKKGRSFCSLIYAFMLFTYVIFLWYVDHWS